MRIKSQRPCEILIYSKCFWKPAILALAFTTLAITAYVVVITTSPSGGHTSVDNGLAPIEQHSAYAAEKNVAEEDWSALDSKKSSDPPPPPPTLSDKLRNGLWEEPRTTTVGEYPIYQTTAEKSSEIETVVSTTWQQPKPRPAATAPKLVKKASKNKKPTKKSPPEFRWCPLGDDSLTPVDCEALFSGDEKAVEQYKEWRPPCDLSDYRVAEYAENCTTLNRYFPFEFDFEFPAESRRYPLAYVLVVEKNAEQVLRLLRSVYRRQNLYCLTYDEHSGDDFKRAMRNIAACYDNVLMPKEHRPINWGGFSILEANVECLKLLHSHRHDWRYAQMLSWNDFPLKTNEETVRIFTTLNGSQDSELKDGEPYRYIRYYVEDRADAERDSMTKPVPPGDLYIYKGSLATSLSREFVNFAFTNEAAIRYYEYSKSMLIPEEQFWATLIHNLHIHPPGGFPGICKHYFWYKQKRKKPWISRYQMWKEVKDPCEGQWTHKSCVFGVGDLWSLKPRPELMAHKIYADFQPAAAYCLDRLHFNRTYFGRSSDDTLDMSFYENLPAVKYHNLIDKSKFNCVG